MTDHTPSDRSIDSADDLETAIGRVLSATVAGGVDPRGSFVYRTDGSTSDWEVMVVELDGGGE